MADKAGQSDYLKQCIEERLKSINGNRVFYRKRSYLLYIISAILSSIATILLGLNFDCIKEYVRIGTLIITASLTLLNAYNVFFSYKDLWIANNTASNRFRKLQFEIEYSEKKELPISDANMEAFKNEYQSILDELNSAWQNSRVTKKS